MFDAMGTQWRVGLQPYGLDYGTLPAVLRMMGVPRSEWQEVFDDVRVMEDEALKQMHRKG